VSEVRSRASPGEAQFLQPHSSTHQTPRDRTGTHNRTDERAQEARSEDVLAVFHPEGLRAYTPRGSAGQGVSAPSIAGASFPKSALRAAGGYRPKTRSRHTSDDVPAAAPRYAVSDAFDIIDCTAVAHVAGAVAATSDALPQSGAMPRMSGDLPWLVLKTNGGQTYDMDGRASIGLGWRGDAHTGRGVFVVVG
jgi:hypothetical protein